MEFLVPLVAPVLSGIMKYVFQTLFTQEVAKRVFIDMGWELSQKHPFLVPYVNTVAKAFDFKYKPELDK